MEANRDGDPLRMVSCQADAAGQIGFGLPMQDNVTHGTDRYQSTGCSPCYSDEIMFVGALNMC